MVSSPKLLLTENNASFRILITGKRKAMTKRELIKLGNHFTRLYRIPEVNVLKPAPRSTTRTVFSLCRDADRPLVS